MNRSVSVVIPTCGCRDYFVPCLESLRRQTCPPSEVLLVNNSLSAELEQKARELYPLIKVITPDRNLYYGASLNRGIAMSTGDFILCLNDDAILDKDFISEALKGFDENEAIGMVGGKILRPDRKTLDTTGLFLSGCRTARERGYGCLDRGQFEKPGFIFGVCGAVALYRRKMLEDIREEGDWFDPDLRMFYEDLDLAWRAHRAGWRGRYVPTALAYHVRGGSVRKDPGQGKGIARRYLDDAMHKELIKNRYLTIIKNETFRGFLLYLVPMILYDLWSWTYVLCSRRRVAALIFLEGQCFSRAMEKRSSKRSRRGYPKTCR